jgi:hypothetical protein
MTHLVFIFLLFLSSGGDNKREFFSPDKTVLAEVYNFVDTARGEVLESHLRVFTKKGRSLLDKSFASPDGEHGFGIYRAEWSADSRFLVVGMSSSGGHMPWQVFTSVFSISTLQLVNINMMMPITAYKLIPPDSLQITTFAKNIKYPKVITVSLPHLIDHK